MRSKNIDLDDIGYIGIGRSMTEEETRLASEHIQAYKAKHPSPKHKPAKRDSTDKRMHDAVKSLPKKAKGTDAKLKTLDDIGHIGGDRPYTDEDARIVSAFIQARKVAKRKAKRAVAKKTPVRTTTKRSPKVNSRVD
jgi:hypothetical protein